MIIADPSKRKYQIYKTSTPKTDDLRKNALSALKTKHEQETEAEKQQIKDNKKILDDKTKEKASKLEELEYKWVKDGFVIKKVLGRGLQTLENLRNVKKPF